MRLILSCSLGLLLVLLFSSLPDAQPAPGMAAPSRLYESTMSQTGGPVVVDLAHIPQGSGRTSLFELYNADEEDRHEVEPSLLPQIEPTRIPRHFEQTDQAAMGIEPSRPASFNSSTPALRTTFPGIGATGLMQPDSIVAAGPTRIMVAVNTTVALYNKTGQRRFQTTFDRWFAPLATIAGGSTLFDPQLLFDQYTGHYIFLCDARRNDHRSWYLFSVSKTSDPEGAWAFWAVDIQLTGGARPDLWADYPRLGVDQNAIYLTANMFTFRTYVFRYGKIRVLKKSQVYAFGSLTNYEFSQMVDATGEYPQNIHASHSYGTAPVEYLVNTRNDASDKITLWAVSNSATKPVLAMIPVAVSSYEAPPAAQQKGGGALINTATEGTGALSATFRNGFIYTAHAIAHNWGKGNVSAIRYYQISTAGSVIQETTYGSPDLSYYMPAVTVNNRGDVVMVFNRSGKSQFAGIYYAGRRSSDPPGTFSESAALHPGEANYAITFKGVSIARWGDYNGIAVDPANQSFWIYGQFAKSGDEWDTTIGQVGF